MKDLTLVEFIREKIVDSEHVALKGLMYAFNPISEVTAFMGKGRSIRQEYAYKKENFIYDAAFDYRYHSLVKPKNDLNTYCKVSGGKLETIRLNKNNIADGSYISSLQAYTEVMRCNVEALKSEIKIAPDISLPLHASKQQLATTYAELTESRNIRSGIYEARRSINRAINERAFGEFACIKDNKTLWSINIMPLRLTSGYGFNRNNPIYTLSIGVVPLKQIANK